MKQYKCVEDKRIYTEDQLKSLFQFKVIHGYDGDFESWVIAETKNGYLRLLSDVEITKKHIGGYNK